jgi:hypothetical protein
MACRNRYLAGVLALVVAILGPAVADVVELKPDHPERYVVVKGDTLWDISAHFLEDPWRWASVWKINQQIKNPHLIYPGDVIVLTYVDGRPELTVLREEEYTPTEVVEEVEEVEEDGERTGRVRRLKPKVHIEPLKEAIPTISPAAILPFLSQPLAVSKRDLDRAGYVVLGRDDRVALGDRSQFYARGLGRDPDDYYQIFRRGKELRNPRTNEFLAYEAIYLGDAELLADGDPSKLVVTKVKQEILPADRLLKAPKHAALPYYMPRAPDKNVRGYIVQALNSVEEFGPLTIVAISLGEREGMEEGHVLRIKYNAGKRLDPVTRRYFKVPEEDSGLLMIFRVFDKVSYALIMSAEQPIRINDIVETP